jgi:hypothetical protein
MYVRFRRRSSRAPDRPARVNPKAGLIGAFLVLVLIGCEPIRADEWTYYFGSTWTRWKAKGGLQGHRQDCRTIECDTQDFRRGNLDSSIGYRMGMERPIWTAAWGSLGGGMDLSLVPTEYNLSQRNVVMSQASLFVSVVKPFPAADFSLRGGTGAAVTDDGRSRGVSLFELSGDFPLDPTTRLRLSWRKSYLGGAQLRDVTASIVPSSPAQDHRGTTWDYALYWGISDPNSGRSLSLSRVPLWRHALHYHPVERAHRIGITLTTTAHESLLRTDFQGTPGNQRGKTIVGYALGWSREIWWERIRVSPGASIELSNWDDAYGLLQKKGEAFRSGITGAIAVGTELELPLDRSWTLRLVAEQVYWPKLGLAESRILAGTGVRFD